MYCSDVAICWESVKAVSQHGSRFVVIWCFYNMFCLPLSPKRRYSFITLYDLPFSFSVLILALQAIITTNRRKPLLSPPTPPPDWCVAPINPAVLGNYCDSWNDVWCAAVLMGSEVSRPELMLLIWGHDMGRRGGQLIETAERLTHVARLSGGLFRSV